jgi:hypothetical protein
LPLKKAKKDPQAAPEASGPLRVFFAGAEEGT